LAAHLLACAAQLHAPAANLHLTCVLQVASLLANGGIGKLQSFSVCVLIPRGIFGAEDIRWKPSLAGTATSGAQAATTCRYQH
jgi:hypothetical protein